MPRKPFTPETGAVQVVRWHSNGLPRKKTVWRGHGEANARAKVDELRAADPRNTYQYGWKFSDKVAANQYANDALKGNRKPNE
jgi:hypothetical protein